MRRIRYCVAMSLDGYIAGSNGEYDWIVMDPDINFTDMTDQFDTFLVGRKTFEVTRDHGLIGIPSVRTYVFSQTLRQNDYDDVTIVSKNWRYVVKSLREEKGKDIWLFGGGNLFRCLAEEGFVDTVEVAIIPIVLGSGIPLIAEMFTRIDLTLKEQRVYKKTGTVSLVYSLDNAT